MQSGHSLSKLVLLAILATSVCMFQGHSAGAAPGVRQDTNRMPLNLMQRFSGSRAATMEGAATRGAPSKAEGKTSGGETRYVWQPGCVHGFACHQRVWRGRGSMTTKSDVTTTGRFTTTNV